MSKVYVVFSKNTYDEDTMIGVCSSEEKATLVKRAIERRGDSMEVYYMSWEVDGIIIDIVEDLEHEVKNYTEANEILGKLRKSS